MKPICLLLFMAVLAGCGKSPDAAAPEAAPTEPAATVSIATATRKDIEEVVAAQGTLQAAQGASSKLAPQAAGRLMSVLVKEGDQVWAGQVVATLDARAQDAQTRSAEAGYRASVATTNQARLATSALASDAQNGVKVAKLSLQAALSERDGGNQSAQTALKLAQADLTKTLAGARPQEVIQTQDALLQAEATRSRAKTEADRQQLLFEKGVSAKRQVDDANTALDVATAGVESAKQSLELVKAGARQEDRDAAQLRVRQAQELLAQARKSGDAKVSLARAALRQAEGQRLAVEAKAEEARAAQRGTEKAAADVTSARIQADLTTLRAPISGVITRRLLGPGDMADATTPVLEVANIARLDLVASLPAEDAARIRPGQRAQLSSGGSAVVASIGTVDPQSNLAPVRLQVRQNSALRSGMFLTAKIVIRMAKGAIMVPKEALLSRESKTVVMVAAGDTAKETPVTTGAELDGAVEIRTGLTAGAKVVTVGGYELANDAKIKIEEKP